MKRHPVPGATLTAALCVVLSPAMVHSGDHGDVPAAMSDRSTDLADLYAWVSGDGSKVYLIMTLFPDAPPGARFSDAAYYVFHTTSRMTPAATMSVPLDVICSFDSAQRVSCWVGRDPLHFVTGDARSPLGVRTRSGSVRVFTGRRSDHFFMNLEGFQTVSSKLQAMGAGLALDTSGCPTLTGAEARALRQGLSTDRSGAPGRNAFAGQGVLAIVVEVDKALLTRGGPILAVWAATHRKGS